MKPIVRRVVTSVLLGILVSAVGTLVVVFGGTIPGGLDPRIGIGLLVWYPGMGFVIAIFGTVKRHPLFPRLRMRILRGMAIGFAGNLVLTLFLYDLLRQWIGVVTPVFAGVSPFLLIPLEGAIVGGFIDWMATRVAGEGRGLLES